MTDTQEPCPRCGKPRAEWVENDGRGYMFGAQTYCSERCALADSRPDSVVGTEPAPVPGESSRR